MKPEKAGKKMVVPSKQKRKSESDSRHGHPKKKRKVTVSSAKENSSPEDILAQFSEDLAALKTEEKMPNTQLKQIYDSLTGRLLRLEAGAGGQAAAAEVARTVLTSQDGRQLFRILSPTSTAGQAQAALRLLTACVASGAAAARVVLAEFQFGHGRLPQVAAVKNLTADTDVRVTFVSFVLSFMVGRDRLLIQAILDKMTPLVIVLSGLNTDRCSTIHLVLSTFKEALLENPKIAKKSKLRLFNARHLGPMLELYRWKGHQLTWRSRTNKYKKKKKAGAAAAAEDEDDDDAANGADPEERQQVRQNVHEFLTLLFTSHVHGIVFKDASLGTSGANCNPVLLELLRSLARPWRDQLTADLVVSTLSACPDLCQHYLPSLAAQLSPRPSAEWRDAVAMATACVAGCRLPLPTGEEHRLTPEAVCRAAAACCYPPAAREVMRSGISHEDPAVRRASLDLLVAVLDQVRSLQTQLAESAEYGPPARAALAEDVTAHLPTFDQLTTLWSQLAATEPAPRPAELRQLLRALAGCHQVAARWPADAAALARIDAQLPQLALPEEELRELRDELRPLTAGVQAAVGGPDPDKLRPSDVPRILAEIRASLPSAAGSAPCSEAPPPASEAPPPDEEAEPAPAADQPTLSGASAADRLASFVAMATPRLKAAPPPLAELGSLGRQLTAALAEPCDLGDAAVPPPGWVDFVRQALKRSLRQPALGAALLPQLSLLCRRGRFPCLGTAAEGGAEVSAELLHQMTLGHSLFLERVLDPAEEELPLRDALLQLLLELTARCQHVCKSSHVALLLAAYGATLSNTDQLILQLISRYEMAGVSLHTYQPMVWGSAALNFYNPTQGGGLSLKSQPSADDVIGLLDADKMATTCRKLPLKISLKLDQLPCDPTVYDPRFLLSALCQLTAPEQPCDPLRLISAGALSLLLCLLSCRQKAVRAASWAVLARLHGQLQASRHQRLKLVWLTLIDLLRASVSPEQRLPFAVVHTWARLAQVLQDPAHRLFRLTSRCLLRQAAAGRLQLDRVPLFFELFNSANSLEHRAEHGWMVGHLCQSVRQMSDYGVLQRTVTYKLVMGLADSCLAPNRAQLLKVLEVTARIPRALLDLEYRHGLLVWLCGHLRQHGSEPAVRAALASLAAQMALTLRQHLAAGRAARPAALLQNLELFATLLARAVAEDAPARARTERCLQDVRQMMAEA